MNLVGLGVVCGLIGILAVSTWLIEAWVKKRTGEDENE